MIMHYCTCKINLAGQGFHIIDILPTEPMSWPEVQLMMQIHNEENVYDVRPCAVAESEQLAEKRRLMAKYNQKQGLIEQLFPGRNPTSMEMTLPGEYPELPPADEFGVPQAAPAAEEEEVFGRDPPTGPAVFKPRRPFPATTLET